VPSAIAFVDPDSPVLKYLDFHLPEIKLAVDRLRLSVTRLLIQRGYPCIPRSLYPEFVYLMARNDCNESDGGLGNSYPALWKSNLKRPDERRIRLDCYILKIVVIRFDTEGFGAIVCLDRNEVCLYEAMFLAYLRVLFLRLVWELLNYLNLATHIVPN
jgi:hypothetical protein